MSPRRPLAAAAVGVGVALILIAMHISGWLAVPALIVGVALVIDVLINVLSPSTSIAAVPVETGSAAEREYLARSA